MHETNDPRRGRDRGEFGAARAASHLVFPASRTRPAVSCMLAAVLGSKPIVQDEIWSSRLRNSSIRSHVAAKSSAVGEPAALVVGQQLAGDADHGRRSAGLLGESEGDLLVVTPVDQQRRWFTGVDGLGESETGDGNHRGDVVRVGSELFGWAGERLGNDGRAGEPLDREDVAFVQFAVRVRQRQRHRAAVYELPAAAMRSGSMHSSSRGPAATGRRPRGRARSARALRACRR